MSITPTISNPYTVLGGSRRGKVIRYQSPFTVLVLNRGGRLARPELLRELQAQDLGDVLWMEGPEPSYDTESVSRDFPEVRFLLLKAPLSPGERINIGMEEARSRLLLCIWSDMRVLSLPISLRDAQEKREVLCFCPVLKGPGKENTPGCQVPCIRKGRLSLIPSIPKTGEPETLFPFDYCGIYHKEKFLRLGGFDPRIANPYWQKIDFGFRAHLWGESVRWTDSASLLLSQALPTEDTTPDGGYKLFFLKNLAVRFRRDTGRLPYLRLPEYVLRCDTGPISAVKEFREARVWVRKNMFRYKTDARALLRNWKAPV
jgi:hypothetical protein